jgi:3-oxoacyl-[acyl-carrier protein] reductase
VDCAGIADSARSRAGEAKRKEREARVTTGRRAALVTGSASGIGRAEVVALAKAGYDVVINYSRSEAEAKKTEAECKRAGADTLVVQCDVADERSVVKMFDAIKERFGRLDVLCNNAGTSVTPLARDFEKVSVEDWDKVFAVNVRGVFLVTKHAAPLLRQSDDAHIINTNSIVGARPGPQPLPYSASKGALWTMTKALAGALGPDGIRVNGVAPGWM